jgi:hypothetical protein
MPTAAIAAPKISFEKVDMIFASASGSTTIALLLTRRSWGCAAAHSITLYLRVAQSSIVPLHASRGVTEKLEKVL